MRKARGERGQILPIVAVALVGLVGIAAFSIDVGYAYVAKRQLQAAVDAALAGAQNLPDPVTAPATALDYGKANSPGNLPAFVFTYQLKCTATAIIATGCVSTVNPNELFANGTVSTDTWFAGIFGIKHFDMSAHANACSPCSSTPVDIVIALDRTGSMCDTKDANNFCRDLDNAKDGIQTMLKDSQPALRAGGNGRVPTGADDIDGCLLCAIPFRRRLERLRRARTRVRDRLPQTQLQAERHLEPCVGPRPPYDGRPLQRVCAGGR